MLSNLRILQGTALRSEVLYFTTEERPSDPSGLAPFCAAAHHATARRPYIDFTVGERLLQRCAYLLRAVTNTPGHSYPFSARYDAVGAGQLILEHARRVEADAVVLPGLLVHYAPSLARAGFLVIIDAPDVLSDLSRRFLLSEAPRSPLRTPGLFVNWLACRSQERLFLKWCDEIWSTSMREATRLREIEPNCPVLVVGNCLDQSAIPTTPLPSERRVGLLGTYSYAPNLRAAEHLAIEVFPRVLRRCPDARLAIAGSGLPPGVERRLSALGGVEVVGSVPDSGEFIRSCSVMALPIFVRGGVPLKLVEAMACGRPVVASPELVAGLPLSPGRDLMVAAGPTEFADCIADLLLDRMTASAMATAARETFEKSFSLASVRAEVRNRSVLSRLG
ncbi:MAG: glycosyltransferase family 4 protein [Actinomycetota bacterium]|nr:glycosyltransferase family 4 protein [Actinomycetota bacterium]